MLSELLPRALLIVTVLALAVPAQAKGGAVSIGQSNPGTLDINRTIDPQTLVIQVGAVAVPAMAAVLSPLQPNAGAGGLPLTATNSGAIAAPSGTAVLGATGRDMSECMAAWETKIHITKSRWREICAQTLVEPQI
jgi:hypothetical protein